MGKGSAPRPLSVPHDQFAAQHQVIFGAKPRKQWIPPPIEHCPRCSGYGHTPENCRWPLLPGEQQEKNQ